MKMNEFNLHVSFLSLYKQLPVAFVFIGSTNWACYHYSPEENQRLKNNLETQKSTCEKNGRVLTLGENSNYPGCGPERCWCCRPAVGIYEINDIL